MPVNDYRVATGWGKLEKVREFEWLGKDQGKICIVSIKSGKLSFHDEKSENFALEDL